MKQILSKINVFSFILLITNLFLLNSAFGQCPASGSYTVSSSQNWTAISGISACSSALTTANSTFNGNVSISYSGSNNNLTFNVNNLTIKGNLVVSSTANGNVFTVAANTTLTIIGDLGDPANNNLSYQLGSGAVLIVTGTIYGKNGNTIGGSGGTVSAGGVDFSPGNLDCVSGDCPKLNVTTCTDGGTACSVNNNNTCSSSYGGTVSSNQSSCLSSFDPTVLTVSGFTGSVVRWEKSTNGGTSWTGVNNAGSTYDPPSISTTTMYRAVVLNTSSTSCISYSTSATATVSAPVPTTPGSITGTSTVCQGTSSVSYSVAAIANATSYVWSYSGTGATITGTTNSPTITFAANATSGNLTVYGVNSCGNGAVSANYAVTVNPLPSSAGTISGTSTVCQGTPSVSYSIAAIANATSYVWSYSGTGATITGTTNSPTITFATNATSGNLTVYGVNSCGNGAVSANYAVIVNPLPLSAGTISGTSTVCQGTSSVSYSVAAIANATSYVWSYSGTGATITGTTNSPTITFATNATSGNLTVYGVNSCGNGAVSANYAVTVNPLPSSASTITGTSTVCQGTSSVSYSVAAIANATSYVWSYSGTGATITGATNSPTITFATNATSGNLTVYGVNSCGNGAVSANYAVTVDSLPSAPTAGTPTNPNCAVPTGSVVLSSLPATGTIVQTGSRNDTVTITGGGTQTISGLLPGNYNFAVFNGSCTSATVNVTIISPVTNTWSSGSWSNGTPTINQRLVFASDYSNLNDVDIEGCSCQLTGSVAVTIKSGRTLKIENGVDVASTASLTFENNASLVQINDDPTINSGKIIYKRKTPPLNRYDFTYWSSPVAGQTLKALSPSTLYDKYYSYNPNTGWVISYNGVAVMEKGRGYIVRAPQTYAISGNPTAFQASFEGIPNNGVVSFAIAGNLVHLLGNPYPSAIDANAFLDANSTVLEGTLYFWTHNSAPSTGVVGGDATYSYTTNDYATYNRTGGVSTAKAVFTGMVAPIGKIAAGQGFFAPASVAGGTVVFNNSMRVSGGVSGANNSQFFKLSTSKTTTTTAAIEKNRIWLNLFNNEGAFKQTLIGYVTGATNNYDGGFDGVTYDGNAFLDFYSVNQSVNLSIQGRALPFVEKDSVALGYKSTIKGEFQINIDHTDGVLSSQDVFLEDKDLKIVHNLKKGTYTFNTEKGVFNNRFVLRYVDKNAVEPVVETPKVDEPVLVSVQQNEITVSSSEDLISKIIIYDISGKIIYQKEDVAASDYIIERLLSSQQVLFVSVILQNGKTTSSKIIY